MVAPGLRTIHEEISWTDIHAVPPYQLGKFVLHTAPRASIRIPNMNLCLVLFALVAIVFAKADRYPTKYDDVDVDRILQNGRVLSNYIKCMLEEGPCTNEGRELKKTLPDALSTGCSKCNEKQKVTADKVINHLRNRRPRDWERLSAKYDPNNEYKKRFEESQTIKKT